MHVDGLPIEVVRKPIKNLHLGVYPPDGHVRIAVPLALNDEAVRLAVVHRLSWIKRQRASFQAQPRQSEREMVTGETHFFLGRGYRLRVNEHAGTPAVHLAGNATLVLEVRPGTCAAKRQLVLERWYRHQLRRLSEPMVHKWQEELGVQPADWGIRRMKTKWGSCSAQTGRIWLNLELAKKPVSCIEYVITHELVHLLERRHGPRFVAIMDGSLHDWRLRRDQLNGAPLAHERWPISCNS